MQWIGSIAVYISNQV